MTKVAADKEAWSAKVAQIKQAFSTELAQERVPKDLSGRHPSHRIMLLRRSKSQSQPLSGWHSRATNIPSNSSWSTKLKQIRSRFRVGTLGHGCLLYFVKNSEELAGTLCHEVSHTIHHDAMNRIRENQKTLAVELGAMDPARSYSPRAIAINMLADLRSNKYFARSKFGRHHRLRYMRRRRVQPVWFDPAVS